MRYLLKERAEPIVRQSVFACEERELNLMVVESTRQLNR
jgi:hypothetical protein